MMRSQVAMSSASGGCLAWMMPALLTSTWAGPCSSSMRAAVAATAASSEMSQA